MKVYLEFTLSMKPEWKTWARSARDRFTYHFERKHASDTYDGNIDFFVSANGWGSDEVWGNVTLHVPSDYADDWRSEWRSEEDEYIECAKDAIANVIDLDLGAQEQQVIHGIKDVKITSGLKQVKKLKPKKSDKFKYANYWNVKSLKDY